MSGLINENIFNKWIKDYSQARYDFNPKSLSKRETIAIKALAREKRSDYGIAPIGTNTFDYIMSKEKNVYFESQPFNNMDLDGMIFVPSKSRDIAFIILNSNQPLLNQIFAAAHEYYHFLTDIEQVRKNPHVCSLSQLDKKVEQKASRFAAEFLLPDEALKIQIDEWLSLINKDEVEDAETTEVTTLCYLLTVKYCLPLKAVLYRLFEEGYIESKTFDLLLSNYTFIKDTFTKAKNVYEREIDQLLQKGNPYIHEIMYELVPKAFDNGYVSLDKLEQDAKLLGLEKERFGLDIDENDGEEDVDLMSLKKKLKDKLNSNGDT